MPRSYRVISWQEHMWRRLSLWLLIGAWCTAFSGNLAQAQEAIGNAPGPENEQLPPNLPPSIASSIPVLAQFKKGLLDLGYNLQWTYFADGLGNPTGGVRQGAIYEGILYMVLDADLAKIASLDGLSFRVSAFQIHGGRLSASNIFNLATVDSIEARPASRLFELWVEQKFGDLAFLRVGQLAADNQFSISEFGNTLYINSTFGWPTIFTQDLPGEGPGYPLTTPGVRLKVTPNDQFALLAGLYNGDPSGAGFTGLSEVLDPAGLNFRLRDPPLLLGEVQHLYNQNKAAPGLAGTVKLGAWYHFGKFDDQHFDVDGKSLADPSSKGVARTHSGDYGVYGVIDQMLWRSPGDDPKKGVGAFARAFVSPSDRNLIDFSAYAGVNFMGLWDKRPDDSLGLAAAFLQLSPNLRGLDREKAFFAKTALPLRNYELVVELTYQARIVAGWTIQPDFQYIFHPGGGVIDPLNPFVGRIPDAAVFALRTAISF
ncbi:MAG TPA: carbohydrate porin [Methylocella sp.]|nr:carbohydrate porin [Methylocella sp.]